MEGLTLNHIQVIGQVGDFIEADGHRKGVGITLSGIFVLSGATSFQALLCWQSPDNV